MRKVIAMAMLIMPFLLFGQTAYWTSKNDGSHKRVELSNGTLTTLGTSVTGLTAGDIANDGYLYGIKGSTNEYYKIDTATGNATLISTVTPAANHSWTGMAFDDDTGIMYALSSYSIATGECKLYTMNVATGAITLVGTETDATAILCIAIDSAGQMYGLDAAATSKLYKIDKTDASVTFVTDTDLPMAGTGHGMDWHFEDNVMYVATYNSMMMTSSIRSLDLVTGNTTEITMVPSWTGTYASSTVFEVDFSSDITTVCTGDSVHFINNSKGTTSWLWSFEGGTPATSTEKNPAVVYDSIGDFNVKLVGYGGPNSDSTTKPDYIHTIETPAQCNMPEGDTSVCNGGYYNYETDEVDYATGYEWELSPAEAGTLETSLNHATFEVSNTYTGNFSIKVRATNSCGNGEWSDELEGNVYQSATLFNLEGGGDYCEGGTGVEITQDGSELDINYELYLNGTPTGNIVAGTGSAISFGLVTDPGDYESHADNSHCLTTMIGSVTVGLLYAPGQPATPTGPETVCNTDTSNYTSTGVSEANSYVWELTPSDAGTITYDSLEATVIWSGSFSGNAYISLYGVNDCGDGISSDSLEVTVNPKPQPEITGSSTVCDYQDGDYTTDEIAGAIYTWTTTGGGTISNGQGTNSITVTWGGAGNGTVSVTVESAEGCTGISDAFDVLIDDCTGINDPNESNEISIRPNPANDFVTVSAGIPISSISVYNASGKKIISNNENAKIVKLNISGLNGGVYFIKITTAQGVSTKRIVKK